MLSEHNLMNGWLLQILKPAELWEMLGWVHIWTSANPQTKFLPPQYPGRVNIPSTDATPQGGIKQAFRYLAWRM